MLRELEECDMVIGRGKREMGVMLLCASTAKNIIRGAGVILTSHAHPGPELGLRAMRRTSDGIQPILARDPSWVAPSPGHVTAIYEVRGSPSTTLKVFIGVSNFDPITDTYNYLTLVIRAIMYFNPLRIFLPLTLALLLLGVGKAVADVVRFDWHIATSTVMLILTAVQIGAMGMLADLVARKTNLRGGRR
jgi:hypothetical protein